MPLTFHDNSAQTLWALCILSRELSKGFLQGRGHWSHYGRISRGVYSI